MSARDRRYREQDAHLVVAARGGDGRAFDELIAAYLPLLYDIVGRALDGHADVDDVVQETLLRVVRDLPALRDPDRFRPWLVAIAIRQISTHRSRRERAVPVPEVDAAPADVLALAHMDLTGQ